MNKEILTAQLDLYKKGREQALAAFEKVKADINSFNGAIEACENLLRIEEGLTNSEEKNNTEVKINA